MTQGQFRAADYGVIFDGQSLPLNPQPGTTNFPALLMDGRPAPHGVPAVAGLGWTQLDNDIPSRVGPFLKMAPVIVYVMVGGTTQINFGASAANIYASEGAIAADVAAAMPGGSTLYVIGTTTTPSTNFDAGEDVVLATLNALKIADASNFYDAVVQVAEDPRMDDPTDGTYYSDGTHLSTTSPGGHEVFAELIAPALDGLL